MLDFSKQCFTFAWSWERRTREHFALDALVKNWTEVDFEFNQNIIKLMRNNAKEPACCIAHEQNTNSCTNYYLCKRKIRASTSLFWCDLLNCFQIFFSQDSQWLCVYFTFVVLLFSSTKICYKKTNAKQCAIEIKEPEEKSRRLWHSVHHLWWKRKPELNFDEATGI